MEATKPTTTNVLHTDRTQAMLNHMGKLRIERAISQMVMLNTLEDMAKRLNETGKGLYADRTETFRDGISHLAMVGWNGRMRFGLIPRLSDNDDMPSLALH
jgi:hypothetical protein